jgi:cell division transport system permease protein
MNITKILNLHFRSLTSGAMSILKSPIEHLFNIMVIALVVTILGGVLVITQNSDRWQQNNIHFPQIIIYLKNNATQVDVSKLEANINRYNLKLVNNYQFISKEQGLQELQRDEHLKIVASEVANNTHNPESRAESNENPLPDVLIINTNTADTQLLQPLVNKIQSYQMVEDVQMDNNYANKINDLVHFLKKIAGILQLAFTLLLVLVIYNLIRLQMLIRQDEIMVSRLIGASDSFIMRPLAYYAITQTIIGALVAYGLIHWFINFINNLFLNLSNLFGQSFILVPLSIMQLLQVLLILIALTIFSVFLAVRTVFRNSYTQ